MNRVASLGVIWALLVGLALPAAADRREDRETLEALRGSTCTLSQAIENALAVVPGTVAKARLKSSKKPGGERIWFYKVVVVGEDGDPSVLRFDARTCAGLEPTPPELTMEDAIGVALAEVGGGFPVASKLRFPGLEPVYKVVILLPRSRVVVFVDGVTGDVLGARRWHPKRDASDDADDDSDEDSL